MQQSPRERPVGLPGGLHSPFIVTRVKITGEKFLPQTKFQARHNPQGLFGRQSTQNHRFVDHFILKELSETAL